MNLVRHELGLSSKAKRFPLKSTCLAIYSLTVNAQKPLDAVLARQFPWCKEWETELKGLFAAYVETKQRQNVLDYDDLLLYWAEMMNEPAIVAAVAERFDHVLVDEYQDTNRLQAVVLTRLMPDGRGLTVVGDDAQSIYSFRAAEIRNILDFPTLFTPAARVITLETELPLHAGDPRCFKRGDRTSHRAVHQRPQIGPAAWAEAVPGERSR